MEKKKAKLLKSTYVVWFDLLFYFG